MEKSHNIEEVLETLWVRTQEKHEEQVDCMTLVLEDKSLLGEMEEQHLITLSDGKIALTKKAWQMDGTLSGVTGWESCS
jgi:hypothetical protein